LSTVKRRPPIDTIIRDWLTGIAAGGGEVFSGGNETSLPMTCFETFPWMFLGVALER
jgi:hypothetical protein